MRPLAARTSCPSRRAATAASSPMTGSRPSPTGRSPPAVPASAAGAANDTRGRWPPLASPASGGCCGACGVDPLPTWAASPSDPLPSGPLGRSPRPAAGLAAASVTDNGRSKRRDTAGGRPWNGRLADRCDKPPMYCGVARDEAPPWWDEPGVPPQPAPPALPSPLAMRERPLGSVAAL
ncbi:MAG: hypothetical protein J3K34DRAFT_429872 [Monoraphidium minutum]|nr:MAG: hypothetical protein J3K34DRAFT_429872 [Monoraphidium minutum]